MELISKEEAIKLNQNKYFTGVPCDKGHLSQRYTNCDKCIECNALYCKKRRELKPESYREYNKKTWSVVKETQTPEDKARKNKNRAKYQKKNPGKITAAARKHQLAKLKRTPPWADLLEIEKIYELSAKLTQETKIPHNVDHIIPLQGKLVSGLHVPDNLRVIPARINQIKNNKFNPEEYNA
jgi:hypothetical protein